MQIYKLCNLWNKNWCTKAIHRKSCQKCREIMKKQIRTSKSINKFEWVVQWKTLVRRTEINAVPIKNILTLVCTKSPLHKYLGKMHHSSLQTDSIATNFWGCRNIIFQARIWYFVWICETSSPSSVRGIVEKIIQRTRVFCCCLFCFVWLFMSAAQNFFKELCWKEGCTYDCIYLFVLSR